MEEDFRERGRRSLEYIFNQLDAVQTDQYALAYAAYAFASFNHTQGFEKAVEYINNFRFQSCEWTLSAQYSVTYRSGVFYKKKGHGSAILMERLP